MDVEIISTNLEQGILQIFCLDVSEEHLRRLERMRDDAYEEEILFCFDTKDPKDLSYLRTWLKNQKATKEARTWGEAIQSIVGTITVLPRRYRATSW